VGCCMLCGLRNVCGLLIIMWALVWYMWFFMICGLLCDIWAVVRYVVCCKVCMLLCMWAAVSYVG